MNIYKQGDIVLVPFPYSDNFTVSKKRPVLIISKDSLSKSSYIVTKITSVIRNDYFSLPIFKIDLDFNLEKASEVRTDVVMTIDESLIIKKLGRLKKSGVEKVIRMVQDHIDI
jgi:mRNA interferase MazF